MTAPAGTAAGSERTGRRGGRRGFVVAALAMVALVAVLLVAAPDRPSSVPPFDPSSTDTDGTRAAVELAEALGGEVEVTSSLPGAGVDVVLLFEDLLDPEATEELQRWVEGGGRVVLADPYSALTPLAEPVGVGFLDDDVTLLPGPCDLTSIDGADAFEAVRSPVPAFAFEVGPGTQSCYPDGDAAALVAERMGAGTVVAFGAPRAFTNEHLDQAGNAGLFAALVVPEPGTRVSVLVAGADGSDIDTGEPGGLSDVLPDGSMLALAQLAVAFVVYALHRGRRLGMPVAEDPPVEVAGSELVRAVGGMRQRAGERDLAATALRRAARERLVSRFGLLVDAPPDAVAVTVAGRTDLDLERLRAALLDGPVPDDPTLRWLAGELDAVVGAALDPVAPATTPSTSGPPTDPTARPTSDEERP